MSAQLRKLWLEVNRQQGQKLLHQISAGMAHQLRNTLTGARLALELDQQNRSESAGDEVTVALRELEIAKDYVRRLLLVGAGEQQQRREDEQHAAIEQSRHGGGLVGIGDLGRAGSGRSFWCVSGSAERPTGLIALHPATILSAWCFLIRHSTTCSWKR